MPIYFVTIAGNIGVGKSTLVTLLSRKLGWQPVFEAVAENPYLADFYDALRQIVTFVSANREVWTTLRPFHSRIIRKCCLSNLFSIILRGSSEFSRFAKVYHKGLTR